MVKRRNLSADPATELRGMIEALAKRDGQSLTTAPGIKDLGEHGDVVWEDTDPDTGAPRDRSVRRFAVELDSTVERAAALEKRLADSEAELDEAREGLANLREKDLPALREQLANVGDVDFSEFDAKIAAAEAKIAASEEAWRDSLKAEKDAREGAMADVRGDVESFKGDVSGALSSTSQYLNEALQKERQERYDADAETQQAVARDVANRAELLNSSINSVHENAERNLADAKAELAESDKALSDRIDGVFRNMTVTDTAYLSNAVVGSLAARIAKVIELEASRITAGKIGAAQINVVELAGEVARFITLDASQLRITDKADIDEAVVRALAARTADIQEAFIQNLRTNGAAIDEAVIGDLAANIITSGLFRTAKEGQRWEIDSNGIVMYTPNDDGVDTEVVRLGPAGENLITVGNSTVSATSVASPLGTFDSVTVGGDDILELIAALPRGVVAHCALNTTSAWHAGTTEVPRVKITADLQPDRMYRASTNAHFIDSPNATINVVETLRWAYGEDVTSKDNNMAQGRFQVARGSAQAVPGLEGILDTGSWDESRQVSIALTFMGGGADSRYIAAPAYPCRLTLEDIGPAKPASGMSYQNVGTSLQVQTPPPATPQETTRTVTWNAGSYGGDINDGHVIQGTYGRYGNRTGGWIAHSKMMDTLRGAKIHKIEVYLRNAHWYYGKGGTAVIRPNNGSYKWSFEAKMLSGGWPRGASRWVTLPGDWGQHFASGLYRGISLYTTNPSGEYYGRFWGDGMKFRVTFTK